MTRLIGVAVGLVASVAGCQVLNEHREQENHGASGGGPLPAESASGVSKPATDPPPPAATDGLVTLPGGEFVMGSTDGAFDERPSHQVRLRAFRIDRYEVTNERFGRFVKASGRVPQGPWRRGFAPGQERFPVRYVSWHDAQEFCRWAGGRLPTEAEWEYAARGPHSRRYPWGDAWDPSAAHAGAAATAGPTVVGSHPKGATPHGVHDMAGNVWEWVADWYDRWIYEKRGDVTESPTGPVDGAPVEPRFVTSGTAPGNERSTLKVMRGGGWTGHGPETTRGSKRMFGRPDAWFSDTGFRCAAPGKN